MIRAVRGRDLLDEGLAQRAEEGVLGADGEHAAIARLEPAPVAVAVEAGRRVELRDGLRHAAREGRQDGRHAERALAGQDLALELHLALDEVLREGPRPAFDIDHAIPREKARAREVRLHLLPADPEAIKDTLHDVLLPREREREVDAAHSHPVDFSLPPAPIPPCLGVTECAHIFVVAPLH